ncbi:pyruvate dehydrogenase E1 component subunit beta [Marinibactrum halimedae]|uniref:2-oxoisovalerate dehydrogenase subunit beta n=2 Tax=Marinibactrum halimedae TaxID=1444977 RepID=A0AA37TCK7_9GAMM|nr:pyruvate dehydrogenase E1 component subunit beta [Marinibactrum halimedae]
MNAPLKELQPNAKVLKDQTLLEAVNAALFTAMGNDDDVVLLGEDVGMNGGVFRATAGLQEAFGNHRVMDTPLAEALIAGVAVGMSTQGLKPVAELQFMGFVFPAFEHIACHAARMRNRTRGRLSCPIVFRAPFGGGIHAPEHHSESTEALFAHLPGIRVVIPSSPRRAYGLLLSAIESPDPVLFLEPKRIYRSLKSDIIDDGQGLPLDTCFTLKEGSDITLVSWGALVTETLDAAHELEAHGISAEVIDLGTIKPLDEATILASVMKTGRCVIAHEACHSFGVGAEIAAMLAEKALFNLRAPIARVTGYDTIMPLPTNEHYYMPRTNDIVEAAINTLQYE